MKNWGKYFSVFLVFSLMLLVLAGCGGGQAQDATANNNATPSNETKTDGASNQASGSGQIEKIEARLAHNMPDSHHTAKGMQMFADLVKEKSNGQIQISVYPSGQLYDDNAVPEAVTSGAVELGMTTFTKWAGLLPAAELWGLPSLFPNYEAIHQGLKDGIADILQTELNKLGAQPIIWVDYGFGYIASKGKPLDSKANYKGMRVRVLSPIGAKEVELMGGSSVSMGGAEVEQALQRGTIDAGGSGLTSFVSRHYYEFTDYVVGPDNFGMFSLSANKKWWDGLSDPAKKVITEAAAETQQWISDEVAKEEEEAKKTLEEKGMKFVPVKEEEFQDVYDTLINEYIQRSGDVGKQLVDIAKEARENSAK